MLFGAIGKALLFCGVRLGGKEAQCLSVDKGWQAMSYQR